MVGSGRFRPLVAITAGVSLLIALLTVYFLFSSYSRYRARDFQFATQNGDFSIIGTADGTCVGTPTKTIFEGGGYHEGGWACDADNKKRLGKLLMASVHGLYHASAQLSPTPDPYLVAVTEKVVTAVLGGTDTPGINVTSAHLAFTALDAVTVPTSCHTIYGGAVLDPTMTNAVPTDPVIDCAGETAGTLVAASVNKLYTHCVLQHSYGRSGPDDGTEGLPVVGGSAPGPLWYPWPNVTSFNETSAWDVKARMFVGMRFSWALTAYVTAGLATGFMVIDAACVLLAELTWPDRAQSTKGQTGSAPDALGRNRLSRYGRSFLRMISTHVAKRARRFILYLILVAVMISFYAVAIWSTWGFGRRLGRPICEVPGAEADLNFDWDLYGGGKRARGGWQPDWNATILELGVIIANCFVLVAIPISESLPAWGLRQAEIPATNTIIGRALNASTDSRAQWTAILQVVVWTGVVFVAVGNGFVSNAFNGAWARAVAGESGLGWNEVEVSGYIFDQGTAFILAMMTGGFTSAAVQARWLINGLGCNTALVFFAWVAFALGAFLPMVIVFSVDYFTDDKKAVAECTIFETGGSDWDKEVCNYKRIFMIVALACYVSAVVFQTVGGLLQYFPSLCSSDKQSKVNTNQVGPTNSQLPPGAGGYVSRDEPFFNFKTALSDNSTAALNGCNDETRINLLRPNSPVGDHPGSLPLASKESTEATEATNKLSFRLNLRVQ